jgi:hypothetical protein
MPTPSFKLTTRRQAEFRRERAKFKKIKDEALKRAFLATCQWWPVEAWQKGQTGMRWYPTAVGIFMLDDAHPFGFATPEEAQAHGLKMQAEYQVPQPASAAA